MKTNEELWFGLFHFEDAFQANVRVLGDILGKEKMESYQRKIMAIYAELNPEFMSLN